MGAYTIYCGSHIFGETGYTSNIQQAAKGWEYEPHLSVPMRRRYAHH